VIFFSSSFYKFYLSVLGKPDFIVRVNSNLSVVFSIVKKIDFLHRLTAFKNKKKRLLKKLCLLSHPKSLKLSQICQVIFIEFRLEFIANKLCTRVLTIESRTFFYKRSFIFFKFKFKERRKACTYC
jgi:hypothetical protein